MEEEEVELEAEVEVPMELQVRCHGGTSSRGVQVQTEGRVEKSVKH